MRNGLKWLKLTALFHAFFAQSTSSLYPHGGKVPLCNLHEDMTCRKLIENALLHNPFPQFTSTWELKARCAAATGGATGDFNEEKLGSKQQKGWCNIYIYIDTVIYVYIYIYDLSISIVRLQSPHQQFDPENSKCLDILDESNPLSPPFGGVYVRWGMVTGTTAVPLDIGSHVKLGR